MTLGGRWRDSDRSSPRLDSEPWANRSTVPVGGRARRARPAVHRTLRCAVAPVRRTGAVTLGRKWRSPTGPRRAATRRPRANRSTVPRERTAPCRARGKHPGVLALPYSRAAPRESRAQTCLRTPDQRRITAVVQTELAAARPRGAPEVPRTLRVRVRPRQDHPACRAISATRPKSTSFCLRNPQHPAAGTRGRQAARYTERAFIEREARQAGRLHNIVTRAGRRVTRAVAPTAPPPPGRAGRRRRRRSPAPAAGRQSRPARSRCSPG